MTTLLRATALGFVLPSSGPIPRPEKLAAAPECSPTGSRTANSQKHGCRCSPWARCGPMPSRKSIGRARRQSSKGASVGGLMGRPRAMRGRTLSRGQATAQPSPQAVSAHSGHDRSAKNTAAYASPASITRTIRTRAVVPPACCTVAAASTYIRSSASGSYQNPAYSWQLGSKMDGTHLSYG